MFIPYCNLQPSWPEMSLAEVLHISRIALWRIVLVLVLVVGTAGILGLHSVDEVSESRSRFIDSFGSLRVLEGRLAGFPYKPIPRQPPSPERIAEAARNFHRWAERQPSSQVAAEMALLRLMEGQRDLAIESLERTSQEQKDALALSDLAAAYLDRGLAEEQPLDLLKALDASSRAVKLNPDLPEARFNQALILKRFLLRHQAAKAWADSLDIEKDPMWIEDIREHLNAFASDSRTAHWEFDPSALVGAAGSGDAQRVFHLVREAPYQARRHAEEVLFGRWARERAEGRVTDAGNTLRMALALGRALRTLGKDSVVEGGALAIWQAEREGGLQLDFLIAGHRAYQEGVELAEKELDQEALARFHQAFLFFSATDSPVRGLALIRIQFCYLYLGEYASVRAQATLLRSGLAQYPLLIARSQRAEGIANFRKGRMAEALELYHSSLALFDRFKDLEGSAAAHFNIAESLRFQGETDAAWWHRLEALKNAHHARHKVHFHNALFDTSESALRQGLPFAALHFQGEMVAAARRDGDALALSEALLRRSRTRLRMGEPEIARRDLGMAEQWLSQISKGTRRSQLEVDHLAIQAEIQARQNPRAAAVLMQAPIDFFAAQGVRFRLPELYRKRAEAFLAAGDSWQAEADLAAGILECEAQRDHVIDTNLRIAYLDQFRPVFDAMVRLQVDHRNAPWEAFNYAESSRARTLFDLIGETRARSLSWSEVQLAIPSKVALIQYTILSDRLLIWALSRTDLAFRSVPIRPDDLKGRVQQFRSHLLRWDSVENAQSGRELYDLLLGSLGSGVTEAETLVLVPDGILHEIPFAALTDSATGRYLVRGKALGYAPSATIYLKSLARERRVKKLSTTQVLIIGDPAFDRAAFPLLKPLPGAMNEAQSIEKLYAQWGAPVDVITGDRATKDAFLEDAPQSGVLHLAVHGTLNEHYPMLSSLALAPTGDDAGALYAHEIYRLRLSRTWLVVLSACWTASGRISPNEGVSSLSRAFLAAGAPVVVGSFWDIKDRTSIGILRNFHQAILRGRSATAALREAQLLSLSETKGHGSSPRTWAAFQISGSGTNPS